jgi:hypothetical protein
MKNRLHRYIFGIESWFVGYLMMVHQFQMLRSFEWRLKNIIDDESIRIWEETVAAYFNALRLY